MAASELGRETLEPNEASLIDRIVALQRQIHDRQGPLVRRAQHPKHHGLCRGELVVAEDLPSDLRHGIFAEPRSYTVWLRFSNGRGDDDTKPTLHGLAMKVMGVDEGGAEQDFLMVDLPVFFIRDLPEYLALFEAQARAPGGFPRTFFFPGINPLGWRLTSLLRIRRARRSIGNLLGVTFFSTTPYRLGPHAVKCSLQPHAANGPDVEPGRDANYLGSRLAASLKDKPASFDFRVLLQTDAQRMPIEDSTVDWERADPAAKWRTVATVHLSPQTPNSPERMRLAENMAYSPWHTLPAHEPLGNINRARRVVYKALSQDRLDANGLAQPATPGDDD